MLQRFRATIVFNHKVSDSPALICTRFLLTPPDIIFPEPCLFSGISWHDGLRKQAI
jgi:hypothetical protein